MIWSWIRSLPRLLGEILTKPQTLVLWLALTVSLLLVAPCRSLVIPPLLSIDKSASLSLALTDSARSTALLLTWQCFLPQRLLLAWAGLTVFYALRAPELLILAEITLSMIIVHMPLAEWWLLRQCHGQGADLCFQAAVVHGVALRTDRIAAALVMSGIVCLCLWRGWMEHLEFKPQAHRQPVLRPRR